MTQKGRKRKLTKEECREIKRMYIHGTPRPWTVSQLARSFGVCTGTINRVTSGTYKPIDEERDGNDRV